MRRLYPVFIGRTTAMAKDGRIGREHGFTPANDHQGDVAPHPMTPEQVRAALRPLVHLLARQAAQEWLNRVANDNAPRRERKTHRPGNLAEFFTESPLRGSVLKAPRTKDGPRKVDL